jgi:hypothetical protein
LAMVAKFVAPGSRSSGTKMMSSIWNWPSAETFGRHTHVQLQVETMRNYVSQWV